MVESILNPEFGLRWWIFGVELRAVEDAEVVPGYGLHGAEAAQEVEMLIEGEPLCVFYSRYGICKFGPSCKFHHPMGVFTYNLSASSADVPVVRDLLGSTSGTGSLTLSSEGLVEAGSVKPRRLSLAETRQPSGDNNIDAEGRMVSQNLSQ